jgi:hypothetical protein
MQTGFRPKPTHVLVVAWAAVFAAILHFGWMETWRALQVDTLPPFADLRVIKAAVEAVGSGIDPQISNPSDPWARPLNYPMIWERIGAFFHMEREVNLLACGGIMVGLYLAACLLFLSRYQSWWLLLCMLSGSSLLAVERGNIDLIIFLLLGCSVFAPALIGAGLIVAATALKVYPIFAVPSLLKCRSYRFVAFVAVAAIAALPFTQFDAIRSGTPILDIMSYGVATIGTYLAQHRGIHVDTSILASCGLVASVLPLLSAKVRGLLAVSSVDDRASQAFLVGAGVFLGTFLLAGNFDYRLIFLSLCVPFLLGISNRILRWMVLTSLLLACNQFLLTAVLGWLPGYVLNMLAKALLFPALLGMFALHLFLHLRNLFSRQVVSMARSQ